MRKSEYNNGNEDEVPDEELSGVFDDREVHNVEQIRQAMAKEKMKAEKF